MDIDPVEPSPPGLASPCRGRDLGELSGGFLAGPQMFIPLLLWVPKQRGNSKMKKKIDIASVPELRTSVGMHGSLKQKEVGGPVCFGVLCAIIVAL